MPKPPDDDDDDVCCPFGSLQGGLDLDDIRVTAYEIFFTSCRSSPGFGGRNALQFYSASLLNNAAAAADHASTSNNGGDNEPPPGSRIKRALGLKMLKQRSRRSNSCGSNPLSPGGPNYGIGFSTVPGGRSRRPLTCAEIMRQQMMVSEASDNRLRKTLMRTLVGQMGRRAETIILPLELLRHLKPSEFNNSNEYHTWQRRQLRILEAGLLHYPSNPLDKDDDNFATCLREIIQGSDLKPIDTGKNSETMRTICNCVVSLSWRSVDGSPTDVCHWADGFPFNVKLYVSLLRSVFDLKDGTSVLDEVDELVELMKKTWTTLGFNKPMHDLCFTWVLFEQYVMTGQVDNDLLSASFTMLTQVANDAKKVEDRRPMYVKMLSSVLTSVTIWCEKRLMDYHQSFNKATIGVMEHILPLVFSATRILEEAAATEKGDITSDSAAGNKVDQYTRSSLKNAFTKMVANGRNLISKTMPFQQVCETLIQLANETEELAFKEKKTFSVVLKRWHPISAGVASVTLHSCYGALLKHFLTCNSDINNDILTVLQRADKLEKVLVNMVVEDSVECEDGGKTVIREMVPYEVDSIILRFLSKSITGRLKRIKDVLHKAKETETWNPKSKTEPYAQSSVELMKQARELVISFFDIPIAISEDLVHDFADGIEKILRDYATFVASCGSKQNYIPTLPPLTRCSRGSKFIKLWKKATPCAVAGMSPYHLGLEEEANHTRPSTSRGTQRLYIRLNTLHYIISQLNSVDKCLSHPSNKIVPSQKNRHTSNRRFEHTRSAIMAATEHVSEVAAYRLIFLDSNSVLYGSLYIGHVVNARISPALKVLKQNLTLLCAIVTDRAQGLAVKEVMKASFEAYLMVLIAGGSGRSFTRADHEMIEDDLKHLKRVFATCGEGGGVEEEVVEKEAETVEGVVGLMGKSTEQLVEDFTVVACEASGIMGSSSGGVGGHQTLPMPPTTGRWSCSDPNTMLRVLCHRKDRVANQFLKRTFHLAKRA
uniref:protein unc-13 homolog n=1 Tax=Erigeron canadensis TaxID=72917 RepID=UPI001CB8B0DE|nr:protein unc-13 homolog [Erigeron canadensis]